MIEHGYFMSKYDRLNDNSFVYLLFYVDNMLIAAKDV